MITIIKVSRCAKCSHLRPVGDFVRGDGTGTRAARCLKCRANCNRRLARRRELAKQAVDAFVALGLRSDGGVK